MHSLNKGGEFSHTKSVLITPLFSKRGAEGEKFAAEVEKGVYEADLVSFVPQFIGGCKGDLNLAGKARKHALGGS
jgi:hypothetical protein